MAEENVFSQNSQFFDELLNELSCSLCKTIYTRPKTLKCLHSFCAKCLVKWSEECSKQNAQLACPICTFPIEFYKQDMSDIPALFGFEPLLKLYQALKPKPIKQDNRLAPKCSGCSKRVTLVAFCIQCNGMICKECIGAHKTLKTILHDHQFTFLKEFTQDSLNIYTKNQVVCKEKGHDKHKLEFYCQVCNKSVCEQCVNEHHSKHDKTSLMEAALAVKKNIKRDKNRAKQLLENYMLDKETYSDNVARLEEEIAAAKKKVHDVVQSKIKMLQDHEMTMLIVLDDMLQKEKTSNDFEQNEINVKMKQIVQYRQQCQEMDGSAIVLKVLDSYPFLKDTCKKLSEKAILSNKPYKKNVSLYYVPDMMTSECLKNPGHIEECVTDPSRCTIEDIHDVRCSFLNTFTIVTRNADLKLCDTSDGLLEVGIQDNDGCDVDKKIEPSGKGVFTVTYRASKPSPYTIKVSIGGNEISNSPAISSTIDSKANFQAVRILGKDIPSDLFNPCSIALSQNGALAVADTGNDRIVLFNSDWKVDRHFGGHDDDDDRLQRPWGVVFNDDRIIVSDNPKDDGRIQEFDATGNYLKTIYRKKGAEMLGMCLTDEHIACLEDGELKRKIKLFNKRTGHAMRDIVVDDITGNPPTFLAHHHGKFFVPFIDDCVVRVFDEHGSVVHSFKKTGKQNGQTSCMAGLVWFNRDMLLACDAGGHCVDVFSSEGVLITSFGSHGDDLSKMTGPIDAVVTPYGQVIVLECNGGRLHLWK